MSPDEPNGNEIENERGIIALKRMSDEIERYLSGISEFEKFLFYHEIEKIHVKARRNIEVQEKAKKYLSFDKSFRDSLKSRWLWASIFFWAMMLIIARNFDIPKADNDDLLFFYAFLGFGFLIFVSGGRIVLSIFSMVLTYTYKFVMDMRYGIEFKDAIWALSGLEGLNREYDLIVDQFPYRDQTIFRIFEEYIIGEKSEFDEKKWAKLQTRYIAACLSVAYGPGRRDFDDDDTSN